MSVKLSSDNNCLLTYGITTNPDPLQASPTQGNPSYSSLVVTVSNTGTSPVYCDKIVFNFLIGKSAYDFASTGDGILVSQNTNDSWQISVTSDGVFTATPINSNSREIYENGLSFQIYNIQANDQVGSFDFYVQEDSTYDKDGSYDTRNNTYELSKFPYGFYVNNFAASSPMIDNGGSVTLTWSGSDEANYYISYNETVVNVSDVRSWTSPPLNNTTTFSLKAVAQVSGETADTYLYLTVIVSNPQLEVTTLNVLQTSSLSGNVSAGASLNVAGNTQLNTLNASGDVNITGSTSLSNATINNSLSVFGNTGMENVNMLGNLSVGGTSNLNNVQISGSLTATSTVVSMMTGAQSIQAGTYQANTDGFVVAQILQPGDTSSYDKVCFGSVYGGAGSLNFSSHGGNYVGHSGWTWALNESFTMPVSSGSVWYVGLYNSSDNSVNCTANFWWVPMGSSPGAHVTYEKLSDEVPEYNGLKPVLRVDEEREAIARNGITDFITALSDAFNQEISDDARNTLEEQFIKLVR